MNSFVNRFQGWAEELLRAELTVLSAPFAAPGQLGRVLVSGASCPMIAAVIHDAIGLAIEGDALGLARPEALSL